MISDYIISEDTSVIEAMKIIDAGAQGCAFVCEGKKLLAAISDGNIRRYILNNGDLMAPIKEVANYSPKFKYTNEIIDYDDYMHRKSIGALPIVDDNKNIVDIVFYNDKSQLNKEQLKLPVVMMAGGKGVRLYPYTKILPKPLIPIGDLPIAEIIINEIKKYACTDYYMIVNHKKNMIKAYFNEIKKDYNVQYIDEDKPLGTGGGLSLLKGMINSTFILTNCDILIRSDLAKIYKEHVEKKNIITMVCCKKPIEVPYGVIEASDDGGIVSMVEKPKIEMLTNTGLYFVEPCVIDELEDDTPIGFPDIIAKYKDAGKRVGIYSIEEDEWLDMGQPEELERMKKILHL